MNKIKLFSAGDCPVCADFGAVVFVKARISSDLFFLCPTCGEAWSRPPSHFAWDNVDPPEKFAPSGIDLPTREEVERAGLGQFVVRELPHDEWGSIIEGYLQR